MKSVCRLAFAFSAVMVLLVLPESQGASPKVWFVRAGATGNGTSSDIPMGSTEMVERLTRENDVIIVLASDMPLQGGLGLKKGQQLIGLVDSGQKPAITNASSDRHNGHGIVLADESRISNVRVVDTFACGIMGTNVSGVCIDRIDVLHSNVSGAFGSSRMVADSEPMACGGIVFDIQGKDVSVKNRVTRCLVKDAAGIGISVLTKHGALSRLLIDDVQVIDGTPVGRFDWGIAAIADGQGSHNALELTDSVVKGRLSRNKWGDRSGRNVVVLAGAHAISNSRIERCRLGMVGQDGILAAVGPTPASASVKINESVIEKAGQTNVEGTILNLPSFEPEKAGDAKVTIAVDKTVIRGVGAVDGARKEQACNILLGGSPFAQQMDENSKEPLAKGQYRLRVHNSRIENSTAFGVIVGGSGSIWADEDRLPPDESTFDVTLRKSTLQGNTAAGILLDVANAKVDARQNHWGDGSVKVDVRPPAKAIQFDASNTIVAAP